MPEDGLIDHRQIDNREWRDHAGKHSEEQEAILGDSPEDREQPTALCIHVEQAKGEMLGFECHDR